MSPRLLCLALLALLLVSCARVAPTFQAAAPATATGAPEHEAATVAATAADSIAEPTSPAPHTPTPRHTATALAATLAPTATSTAAPSPTVDPYAGLTIDDLSARTYGGGALEEVQVLSVTESFTRTVVAYDSDGLTVYGFLNVPFGEGPFPVALVLHGYIPPRQYTTIGYTTRYADFLARAGYLVIHPNYRNHPPSDETAAFAAGLPEEDFRVGYAVDVLNLLAIVRETAGAPGPLLRADAQQLHLLGHSMGGGIAIRVMTVDPTVDAAVLYGSMSADELQNFERIQVWSNGQSGVAELAAPPDDLRRISPLNFLERIQTAVSIHHGELDDIVPVTWSDELCRRLQEIGKTVECFRYPGAPHSFHDEVDRLFLGRVLDFFGRY